MRDHTFRTTTSGNWEYLRNLRKGNGKSQSCPLDGQCWKPVGKDFERYMTKGKESPWEAVALEKDEEEPLSPSKTMTMELEKAG